jgi:hypothetical protein
MFALAWPAVHGRLADLSSGTGEGEISDQYPVIATKGLAAMVADGVDPGLLVFPEVAFSAFPGHKAS